MVASHGWDLLGAHRAGMRTGWVRRNERVPFATDPAPDVEGEGLLEVAVALTGGA